MPRPVVVQTPFRGVGDRSVAAQRDVVFPDMVVVEAHPAIRLYTSLLPLLV